MNYLSINFGIDRSEKYLGKGCTPVDFDEKEKDELDKFEKYINSVLEKTFGIDTSKDVEFVDLNEMGDFHFNNFHSRAVGSCDYKRYLIDRKKLNIKYESIESFIKNILDNNIYKLEEYPEGHWSCCEECNLSGLDCSYNCPNGITLINKDFIFIQIFAQRMDDYELLNKFKQKQQEINFLEKLILEKKQNFKPLGKNNRVNN